MSIPRRELLGVAGGLILGGLGTWAAQRYFVTPAGGPPGPEAGPSCPVGPGQNLTPEEALERLRAGNQRFLEGRSQYRLGFHIPAHVQARDYRPFAVVVCCSDARVPCEILFDERVSDLFVVRQAAHLVDAAARTSIDFAVNYLQAPLVLVLGHAGCRALAAALAAAEPDASPAPYLERLGAGLNSVVKEVHRLPGDPVENAVAANVRYAVRALRGAVTLQPLIREERLLVLGARYHLPAGKIEFLDIP